MSVCEREMVCACVCECVCVCVSILGRHIDDNHRGIAAEGENGSGITEA